MDRIKVASPQIGEEEAAAVREVLLSGRYISGPIVADFERRFADYIGTKEAVAVNSGTAALHAALAAAGIGPGDEVVVPAYTFFSTITPVIHQGAVPIFADISLDNFSLCPEDLARRITPRTKAVIPVHYFGHCAEMDAINAVARDHGLTVIEDCAQAHGSTYHDRKTGSLGQMGAFSFFATKHMTTGEGGIVTTDNEAWADHMRLFRSHGLKGRNDHVTLGYNYRMTEMGAAIGLIQLEKLDRLNQARIANSEALIARLGDLDWLTPPVVPPHVVHSYFWCHVMVDEEKLGMSTQALIGRLSEMGVETRNRYVEPLYKQPVLNENLPEILRLSAGENLPDYGSLRLPNVERAAGHVIGLPNRPDMTEAEISKVIEVLQNIA